MDAPTRRAARADLPQLRATRARGRCRHKSRGRITAESYCPSHVLRSAPELHAESLRSRENEGYLTGESRDQIAPIGRQQHEVSRRATRSPSFSRVASSTEMRSIGRTLPRAVRHSDGASLLPASVVAAAGCGQLLPLQYWLVLFVGSDGQQYVSTHVDGVMHTRPSLQSLCERLALQRSPSRPPSHAGRSAMNPVTARTRRMVRFIVFSMAPQNLTSMAAITRVSDLTRSGRQPSGLAVLV